MRERVLFRYQLLSRIRENCATAVSTSHEFVTAVN